MKRLFFLFIGLASTFQVNSQNLLGTVTYPDTLKSTNDSIYQIIPKFEFKVGFNFSKSDTIVWETYGNKGSNFKIWTDLDTLNISHVNHPYEQVVEIPISSPKNSALLIIKITETLNSNFTENYINSNSNTIDFDIPEVYELANIILFLSDCSVKTMNHPVSEYSKSVEDYFKPYKNHPVIKILSKKCSEDCWSTYYSFRENSICFTFEEGYLEYNTPYTHVLGDPSKTKAGEFREILYLIQDFVVSSNFRKFYQANNNYYNQLINRQGQLLPIKEMWNWLEDEFPMSFDSYKIIFSPLIGGSHSTQKFISGFPENPEFMECIMFINSPESIDSKIDHNEGLKKGLMSGIVFTEIDHNYVNQTSLKHFSQINELIVNKDYWATKEVQKNYPSKAAIFNEYMTHSLFCLFVKESYTQELADVIIAKRIELMNKRGFFNFANFNFKLMQILTNRSLTIYEMYPDIITAMKTLE